MTTEEKARAYDEALEKARMYRDNAKAVEEYAAVARYENIFPVLRESEDERIKNLIYCIVRDRSDVGKLLEANGCPIEKALSWIEKQKEQKPEQYDIDVLEKHITKDSISELAHTVIVRNGWEIVEKEQKPIECIEFDNEFEKQVSHLIASVLNKEYEYSVEYVKYVAQSLLGYAKQELKPGWWTATINGEPIPTENHSVDIPLAVWSEEDEKRIQRICGFLWKNRKGDTDTIYQIEKDADWLKSLPERFNLQPKQEWSDEDEDMLNCCISSIEEAKENRYAYKETDGDTSYDYEIAWLKSLRPVSKESLQPHWNPSKEQMDALKDVAYGTYQNGDGPALRSLYEQLKKLGVKEEPEYYQHFDPNC